MGAQECIPKSGPKGLTAAQGDSLGVDYVVSTLLGQTEAREGLTTRMQEMLDPKEQHMFEGRVLRFCMGPPI